MGASTVTEREPVQYGTHKTAYTAGILLNIVECNKLPPARRQLW